MLAHQFGVLVIVEHKVRLRSAIRPGACGSAPEDRSGEKHAPTRTALAHGYGQYVPKLGTSTDEIPNPHERLLEVDPFAFLHSTAGVKL